jgi:predicted deacylase
MFLEFVNRKKAKKFNEDLIRLTEGKCDLMQIGVENNQQVFKVVINPNAKRTICFIAGIHGNEEAGPYGVLSFLESGFHVPNNKRVIIIPLGNPWGFEKGKRENADNEDINRHFLKKELKGECKLLWDALKTEDIDLLHTLHEDPSTDKFYLYYTHHKKLAEDLRELATKYFIIQKEGEALSKDEKPGQGDKIRDGLCPLPHVVRGTIEDKAIIEKAIPYITTESPGKADLKKRIAYNRDAIKTSINSF